MANLYIAIAWFLLSFFLGYLTNLSAILSSPLWFCLLLIDNPDGFGNGLFLLPELQLLFLLIEYVLWFSSWAVLFSSSRPFMPHLLSQGPFLMLIITIFLSWDPLHSPYVPSNPYAVPCITTRQGIPFAYRFLVMDTYSSSQFSCISCISLLLILFSMTFHDILFLLSGTFYLVPPCSFAYSADLFWSI